jgi:hypothetical protein
MLISLHGRTSFVLTSNQLTAILAGKSFPTTVRNWVQLCTAEINLHDVVGSATAAQQLELREDGVKAHVFQARGNPAVLAFSIQVSGTNPEFKVAHFLFAFSSTHANLHQTSVNTSFPSAESAYIQRFAFNSQNETHRNKIHREGHEFHSCRFSLSEDAASSR